MMLDTPLGKILSTKPVEPSITSNVESTTATTATTTADTTLATTKEEDPKAHSTKSEAEVRLVVRFFVEEHIVFNGKVEKIKQLESEVLSRIVSRIAWDGAKVEKKPILEKDNIKNDENTGCVQENNEQIKLCEPTKIFPYHRESPLPNENKIETIRQHGELSAQNTEKALYPTTIDPMSSPDKAVPNYKEESEIIEEHQLVNDAADEVEEQCDNKPTTLIHAHICETNQQSESSYDVQENVSHHHQQRQQEKKDACQENHNLKADKQPMLNSTIDTIDIESQMIVDTIYDCVYNVDLESRQSDRANGLTNYECVHKEETGDEFITTNNIQHNDTSNELTEVAKIDKKPLAEAANVPPNNESTQETIPNNSGENHIREKDAQSNQAGKTDLNPRMVPTKKLDTTSSCSTKKKLANVGPTNKRIRRVNSKDQRNHRGTNKMAENLIDIRDTLYAETVTDEDNGQFVRHSKVFAKWSDNHFYPGTILKQSRDRKFEIGFLDGARKDIAETDLIPSCNILRKQVRVSIAKDYCVNAIVHEQLLSSNGQLMFDVEYQQNGLVRKCVPLGDIFLTAEQGIPLINQPIKPDKNPDESMFAGVDLDNIVHVKRSRRLQEMEESDAVEEPPGHPSSSANGSKRKRGQYNMRNITNRVRTSNSRVDVSCELVPKRSIPDINNQDTPASSCSPDNLKANLDSSDSNSPLDSSSSREAD